MRKLILLSILFVSINMQAQMLDTFLLADHLVEAVHPDCAEANNTFVTSFPNDSSWVNFIDGAVITGSFGCAWRDGEGFDLILETSYHPDNYKVKLLKSDGTYTSTLDVTTEEWTDLTATFFEYVGQGSCSYGQWNGSQHILPLDFDEDFGILFDEVVVGLEITTLTTSGLPDFAGAYISEFALAGPGNELGPDTTICSDATIALTPGNFMSYAWSDGSTESVLVFDAMNYGLGVHEIGVEACWENCCSEDVINVTVEICSNQEDLNINSELLVYPNPFLDHIQIEATNYNHAVPFSIKNLSGQEVLNGTILSGVIPIETSHWPKGLYSLQVGNEYFKIIKSH